MPVSQPVNSLARRRILRPAPGGLPAIQPTLRQLGRSPLPAHWPTRMPTIPYMIARLSISYRPPTCPPSSPPVCQSLFHLDICSTRQSPPARSAHLSPHPLAWPLAYKQIHPAANSPVSQLANSTTNSPVRPSTCLSHQPVYPPFRLLIGASDHPLHPLRPPRPPFSYAYQPTRCSDLSASPCTSKFLQVYGPFVHRPTLPPVRPPIQRSTEPPLDPTANPPDRPPVIHQSTGGASAQF